MTHTSFRKILILPDAGPKNPFQYLLADFLRKHGFKVDLAPKFQLFSINRAIRKTCPDAVYFDWVHSFILGKNLAATLVKSLTFVLEIFYLRYVRSIPVIHTVHNLQNHRGSQLRIEKFVYRYFLFHCDKIRVYSMATRQEVIDQFKVPPEKVSVIPDIPFHHYYPNSSTKVNSRLHLGIGKKSFVYLFFGRIERYKGIENLITAFSEMALSRDCLLIAGECIDPDYLRKLKDLSGGHPNIVWYNAFVKKNSVQYFFNAADIVVLPFKKIDHSGSVDLSLSFAKPVITLATEAASTLLAHQRFLLFKHTAQLTGLMQKAKNTDLDAIGRQNFKIADAACYQNLLELFKTVKACENENTFRHEYI